MLALKNRPAALVSPQRAGGEKAFMEDFKNENHGIPGILLQDEKDKITDFLTAKCRL